MNRVLDSTFNGGLPTQGAQSSKERKIMESKDRGSKYSTWPKIEWLTDVE